MSRNYISYIPYILLFIKLLLLNIVFFQQPGTALASALDHDSEALICKGLLIAQDGFGYCIGMNYRLWYDHDIEVSMCIGWGRVAWVWGTVTLGRVRLLH